MDWLCGYATIFLKGGQNHFLVTRHVTTYPATGWSPRLKEHAHTAQLRHSKPLGQETWKLSSQGFEWFTSGMLSCRTGISLSLSISYHIMSYQLYRIPILYSCTVYPHSLIYLPWSEDNSMLDQFSFGPIQMNGKPSFWFITALSTQAKIGWTYSLHLETDCSRDASSIDHLRPWNTNTKVQVELERNGLRSDGYWYYYPLYYLHYMLLVSTIYSILPMMPEKWTESRMHEELQWKHSSNIGANSQSCDSNQPNITQAHQTMHLEEWYVDDAAMGIAWKLRAELPERWGKGCKRYVLVVDFKALAIFWLCWSCLVNLTLWNQSIGHSQCRLIHGKLFRIRRQDEPHHFAPTGNPKHHVLNRDWRFAALADR